MLCQKAIRLLSMAEKPIELEYGPGCATVIRKRLKEIV